MKTRALAVAVGALAAAGCGSSTPSSTAAGTQVTITSPADRSTVGGPVVVLELQPTGITIVKPNGDTSGQTGHYHVFIDKDPVPVGTAIPKGPGIIHSEKSPVRIPGLTSGFHTFSVVIGDGTHRRLDGTPAVITILLTGGAPAPSAPAAVPTSPAPAASPSISAPTSPTPATSAQPVPSPAAPGQNSP